MLIKNTSVNQNINHKNRLFMVIIAMIIAVSHSFINYLSTIASSHMLAVMINRLLVAYKIYILHKEMSKKVLSFFELE